MVVHSLPLVQFRSDWGENEYESEKQKVVCSQESTRKTTEV